MEREACTIPVVASLARMGAGVRVLALFIKDAWSARVASRALDDHAGGLAPREQAVVHALLSARQEAPVRPPVPASLHAPSAHLRRRLFLKLEEVAPAPAPMGPWTWLRGAAGPSIAAAAVAVGVFVWSSARGPGQPAISTPVTAITPAPSAPVQHAGADLVPIVVPNGQRVIDGPYYTRVVAGGHGQSLRPHTHARMTASSSPAQGWDMAMVRNTATGVWEVMRARASGQQFVDRSQPPE